MNSESSEGSPVINPDALVPLYKPWEEPNQHRAQGAGGRAKIQKGRRPSQSLMVNSIRASVKEWREMNYYGASDTSRELLEYWFRRGHRLPSENGGGGEFRYYFCQREAIETLIFLLEVRGLRSLASLLVEHGGAQSKLEALGIAPDEDQWARYVFKIATGAGKTKCMSLAVVWSYFHALRESDSPMTKNFLVVAPNLTVFERLKEDFRPDSERSNIFETDPVIPHEWRSDWNLGVVLQDETGGTFTDGVIYLTNVHRLFPKRRRQRRAGGMHDWMGPPVTGSDPLGASVQLREKIAAHDRIMVLNDEAHHLWDPGSAWSKEILHLHEKSVSRSGAAGIVVQLDFSATPQDNKGKVFRHVVCDTPLGEAVDSGIVKTPIIGRIPGVVEQPSDDASRRYDMHLQVGYKRWLSSCEEWKKSKMKPLLFVMCEDTAAADQISKRLNHDKEFEHLNNRTINLHTNLKGQIHKRKRNGRLVEVFEISETEITEDDLKILRKISRELDSDECPYSCIVSVLMLREGWDVKNVTTIVPLRSFSSAANILPEQTLGRGLRRMTPPGQMIELVVVIEHPAFVQLYEKELRKEGVEIEVSTSTHIPTTTVTIFPDPNKNHDSLDIVFPSLSMGNKVLQTLENISIEDVIDASRAFGPLPLGEKGSSEVEYVGHHLFTKEVVERMKVSLRLLKNGYTAISFFVRELVAMCGAIHNAHAVLADLLQYFLEELLFDKKVKLTDPRLVARLSDLDVRAHVRAVFVPLILSRIIRSEVRTDQSRDVSLRHWRPYQVSISERRPVVEAMRTLFNLVPCDSSLEVAMSDLLDFVLDVKAFAKNAGPQALRIDYLTSNNHLAMYVPDFFVRTDGKTYFLVETKGLQDSNVPYKAKAAVEWCRAASEGGFVWQYVFVPQYLMEGFSGTSFAELVRACEPALENLLSNLSENPELPLFSERDNNLACEFYGSEVYDALSDRGKRAAEDALDLYRYFERRTDTPDFVPIFNVLLGPIDDNSGSVIFSLLHDKVPGDHSEQATWFAPSEFESNEYLNLAVNLKRALVYRTPHSPTKLLIDCLKYALNETGVHEGVFSAVHSAFNFRNARQVLDNLIRSDSFRENYVGFGKKALTSRSVAEKNLKQWVRTLAISQL